MNYYEVVYKEKTMDDGTIELVADGMKGNYTELHRFDDSVLVAAEDEIDTFIKKYKGTEKIITSHVKWLDNYTNEQVTRDKEGDLIIIKDKKSLASISS